METSGAGAEELVAGLRSEHLRVTAARRAICAVLAEAHQEHLTAVAIHERAVARAGISIDPSTVYRTIEVLQRLGLLHHVHLGLGPGIVHLADDADHHHLVCERCGRTEDLPPGDVRAALTDLAERYGFAPDSLHVSVIGVCAACAAAR